MSVAVSPHEPGRTTRLTALVSAAEAEAIARRAATAEMSVSAWLRERALGAGEDVAGLREVDRVIERMERDLDGAIAAVTAALGRMDAPA